MTPAGAGGRLGTDVAEALLEHGHDAIVRREAGAGDYSCAAALHRHLLARGEPGAAAEVLRPFAATGLPDAVRRFAHARAEEGALDEALALLRPLADAGDRPALTQLARLLARSGRRDEAFALLRPHVAEVPDVLVEIGADEDLERVLRPHADAGDGDCQQFLADVLQRQGRAAEAVILLRGWLRPDGSYEVGHAERISDILARHDPSALAEWAAGDGGAFGAVRLSRWHEEHGRVDEAVAALEPLATAGNWSVVADLLERHGRTEEAVAVLRPAARAEPEYYLRPLCEMLVDLGRPGEALALAGRGMDRAEILARCGRTGEAIALLRAEPDLDAGFARERLGELLAAAGRLDEAIEVLSASPERRVRATLAMLLIEHGRPEEAVAAVRAGRA
ncbi:hypothetical protein [Dactylosporangium sp. CA-139066]|uniref:hypothetical protein n=1 Tax=Dactylosporangium sp. CA-139066 TaxID=3239930 RepID=UPI003D8BB73A